MFNWRPKVSEPEAGAASPAALERYLSMPVVFGALGAATFLIAWNRGIALIYALFAIFVGVALLSALGPRWMLRPARLRLKLPPEASVGEEITVVVAVESEARPATRYLVKLDSPFPFAPAQGVFLSVCGRGHAREQRVRCAKRGTFELKEVSVSSSYPIGIFTLKRTWKTQPAHVTIFPRVYPVTRFPLPPSSARTSGELERPSPSVGQELIREVREYRSGDNPRHIHWRSSARHDRLMVKQFDAIATSETWIVLDLDLSNHDELYDSLERAIEIAATLASHLIGQGQRCGLAGGLAQDGSPRLLLAPDAGPTHLRAILYALAKVQPEVSADYSTVLAAMAALHRRGQQWILFDHDSTRVPPPSFLRGVPAPLWFRFDRASFTEEEPETLAPAPPARFADGFAIARNTDLSLLFR
jgi:uncharacterized protein (DUF58 family)